MREREDDRWVYGVNPILELLRVRPESIERIFIANGVANGAPGGSAKGRPENGSRASAAAEVLHRAKTAGVRVERVPRERLVSMVGGTHQGVVAEVLAFEYAELDAIVGAAADSHRPSLVVVLDGIQDPQNLGAIIRSSHALGAHGVVIPKDRAAGVTGAVAKASAGALAHCPVARVVNISRALDELREAGLWTVAADPTATQPAWEASLDGPLALVVGAEGTGIREGVLKHCDLRVGIPLAGKVASLNASVAAGVLLYEVDRQRRRAGKKT